MIKSRLHWIDVAKGLLVLMVVYGHLNGHASILGYNKTAIESCDIFSNIFIPFYMPCFFIITGFCSNFNKPFRGFLISSIKSILIPAFFFSFLFSGAYKSIDLLLDFLKDFLLYGGKYWFLCALFIARICYWVVNKYSKKGIYIVVICLISFIFGFALRDIPRKYEYWWFVHALLMIPSLGLGRYLKQDSGDKNSKLYIRSFYIYAASFLLTVLLAKLAVLKTDSFYVVPGITQKLFNLDITMFLPLVILSISGSIALFYFSKKINTNKFIEFLGKNSLVIYCVQGYVINKSFHCLIWICNMVGLNYQSYLISILTILLCFTFSAIVSTGISYIMNLRYLRILIGKF